MSCCTCTSDAGKIEGMMCNGAGYEGDYPYGILGVVHLLALPIKIIAPSLLKKTVLHT
jgi:hypothetical protein